MQQSNCFCSTCSMLEAVCGLHAEGLRHPIQCFLALWFLRQSHCGVQTDLELAGILSTTKRKGKTPQLWLKIGSPLSTPGHHLLSHRTERSFTLTAPTLPGARGLLPSAVPVKVTFPAVTRSTLSKLKGLWKLCTYTERTDSMPVP